MWASYTRKVTLPMLGLSWSYQWEECASLHGNESSKARKVEYLDAVKERRPF